MKPHRASGSRRSDSGGMAGVLLVDAGLVLLLIGAVSLIRPLRFLGFRSRRTAAMCLAAGLASFTAGALLPARLQHVPAHRSRLDDTVPDYQFREHHEIRIAAPPERVFAAVRGVTAREIRFFLLLTWIRSPRIRRAPESILAPRADQPLLDVALRSGFVLLAEEPPREIVFGTLLGQRPPGIRTPEAFRALDTPGVSKAVMNFRIEEQGKNRCLLTTETRIYSTDDSARRTFAAYWRVIYPGSALIRRMWLDAVRRRAEAAPGIGKAPESGIS
jgi:hypothetical protein